MHSRNLFLLSSSNPLSPPHLHITPHYEPGDLSSLRLDFSRCFMFLVTRQLVREARPSPSQSPEFFLPISRSLRPVPSRPSRPASARPFPGSIQSLASPRISSLPS
jgi:hypothetical protein